MAGGRQRGFDARAARRVEAGDAEGLGGHGAELSWVQRRRSAEDGSGACYGGAPRDNGGGARRDSSKGVSVAAWRERGGVLVLLVIHYHRG